MKTSKLLVGIIFTGILLYSCNSALINRGAQPDGNVDSILFYQQADLPDPLIDAVLAETDDEVRLSTTLIPPPPPVPQFKQIEGFRIQVYAGVDSINTLTELTRARELTQDSIYFFSESGLYKIQVGNYPYRIEADQAKQKLKNAGYSGAWVVKTMITVPLDSAAVETGSLKTPPTKSQAKFTIQVLALTNLQDAQLMADEIKIKFGIPVSVKESSSLYKVFIGEFNTREEADEALNKVRNNGYPDAWLVY